MKKIKVDEDLMKQLDILMDHEPQHERSMNIPNHLKALVLKMLNGMSIAPKGPIGGLAFHDSSTSKFKCKYHHGNLGSCKRNDCWNLGACQNTIAK